MYYFRKELEAGIVPLYRIEDMLSYSERKPEVFQLEARSLLLLLTSPKVMGSRV